MTRLNSGKLRFKETTVRNIFQVIWEEGEGGDGRKLLVVNTSGGGERAMEVNE